MAGSWRLVRRLSLGFVLIIAASGVLLVSDWNRGKRPAVSLPRVAVFKYSSQAIIDEGVRGMIDSLRDHGYVDGRTMLLQHFNAENDLPTASSIARELTGGRFDYVFTVSTNCLQAVAKANRDGRVKHVFGVVADPVGAGVGIDAKNPLDHPKNMTGIGTLAPLGELLTMAKRINPQLKQFGLPWNPSQSNSESYTRMARAAAPGLGINLLEGNVESTLGVGEVVASLVGQGADAILVTGDLTVSLAIDSVVSEATKGRVPVFTTQPDLCLRGAFMGMGADFYQVGRETGDLAARILRGEDINRMPVLYSLPMKLVINRGVLPKLRADWVLSPDILAKASEVKSGAALPGKK